MDGMLQTFADSEINITKFDYKSNSGIYFCNSNAPSPTKAASEKMLLFLSESGVFYI